MLETLKELQALAARINYDTCKTDGGKEAQTACRTVITEMVNKTIGGASKEELIQLVADLLSKNKEW